MRPGCLTAVVSEPAEESALLADRREEKGLPRNPLMAFAESGYAATVATES